MTTFVFISLGAILFVVFCIGHIKERRKQIRREQEQHIWKVEQRRLNIYRLNAGRF